MSYSEYFAAYQASPAHPDFLDAILKEPTEFAGSSRSGCFQKAMRELLDAVPGHERLRFMSHQSATLEVKAHGGDMAFTHIEPASCELVLSQLDSLLAYCSSHPEALTGIWAGYFGYPVEEMRRAIAEMKVCSHPNRDVHHGEDGESPFFALSTLVTLRATIARVCLAGGTLVYYTWR